MSVWKYELENDIDKAFLLDGVENGFSICDVENYSNVKCVQVNNHPSVQKYHKLVEKELLTQIDAGNYVYANESTMPTIVSPLGAIPKEGQDGVRVIHDCSRPIGDALNDHALHTSVQYDSLDQAFQFANNGAYMCKIDLKSAYRSVAINPKDYVMTGLSFDFSQESTRSVLYDVRLPFGSAKGPMIFHRISQSVKRMMQRRGFDKVVVYLDDFLIVEDSYEKCCEAQMVLLSLLIKLGFQISWNKVLGPSQKLEFLGVTIDSTVCVASLSDAKVKKLLAKLKGFSVKRRATKRQLQSLAGSLNWACNVVRGGRYFLRRILDSIARLNLPFHKCKLSPEFMKDLDCYLQLVLLFLF